MNHDWSAGFRAEVQATWRTVRDLATGDFFSAARRTPARLAAGRSFGERFVEEQVIRPTGHWEAKVHNMRLAAAQIADVAMDPGVRFSFWTLVGRPAAGRGFVPGRSIVGGTLQTSYGGGLCQLAGVIYSLALRSGLRVHERHAHSVDLYDDTTRFAPLGSDAAVAYGYKDLRLDNRLSTSVCFRFESDAERIRASLCAPGELCAWDVEHRILARGEERVVVETIRRGPAGEIESRGASIYRQGRRMETS